MNAAAITLRIAAVFILAITCPGRCALTPNGRILMGRRTS